MPRIPGFAALGGLLVAVHSEYEPMEVICVGGCEVRQQACPTIAKRKRVDVLVSDAACSDAKRVVIGAARRANEFVAPS